MKKTKTALMW